MGPEQREQWATAGRVSRVQPRCLPPGARGEGEGGEALSPPLRPLVITLPWGMQAPGLRPLHLALCLGGNLGIGCSYLQGIIPQGLSLIAEGLGF